MNTRIAFRILLVASLLSLVLYTWLARYAHPMGDDWSYARMGMDHDLLPWLLDQYSVWNGRYFSNILVWANPIAGGLDRLWLYRCMPVMLLLLTLLSYTVLVRAMLRDVLSTRHQWAGGLLLTALFCFAMPQIGEGLYWYTGAISYQSGTVLTLLLIASVVNHSRGHFLLNRTFSMITIAFLTLAAIGCTEVNMLLIVAGSLAAAAVAWLRTRRASGPLLALVVLAIVGGCFMLLAPGNAVRASYFETKHEFWRSLGMSVLQTGRFGLKWAGLLLLPSSLYLHLSRELAQRHAVFANAFGFNRWWSLAALALVIFLCVFPAYWNTGILGQHRTLNVACAFFLPLWFITLTAWSNRYPMLFGHEGLPRWWPALGIVLTSLLILGLHNGARGVGDMITGTALKYDREMTARYQAIEAARSGQGTIMLPALSAQPEALYLFEIKDDPTFWANRAYGQYFGMRDREFVVAHGKP